MTLFQLGQFERREPEAMGLERRDASQYPGIHMMLCCRMPTCLDLQLDTQRYLEGLIFYIMPKPSARFLTSFNIFHSFYNHTISEQFLHSF